MPPPGGMPKPPGGGPIMPPPGGGPIMPPPGGGPNWALAQPAQIPIVAAVSASVVHHFRMVASPISSRNRIRRITHAESGTILGRFIGVTFRKLELFGKIRIVGKLAAAILRNRADLAQVADLSHRRGETSLARRW
jgi:hypothetical protein